MVVFQVGLSSDEILGFQRDNTEAYGRLLLTQDSPPGTLYAAQTGKSADFRRAVVRGNLLFLAARDPRKQCFLARTSVSGALAAGAVPDQVYCSLFPHDGQPAADRLIVESGADG